MTGKDGLRILRRRNRVALGFGLLFLLNLIPAAAPLQAQSGIPSDRFHLSITLGGYFFVGVGYTHWIERHHALEFTAFPLVFPGKGFPFGLRAGYAWIPSDEVWRAKLGGNIMVLVRPGQAGSDRFTPILNLTPGIQYHPESDRSFRADVWMSYYLKEKVFAPTGLEFFYAWPR
jgi:hypothetical protein